MIVLGKRETRFCGDDADRALIEAIQHGLPLTSRPYAGIGKSMGMDEGEVISRLRVLLDQGVVKRMGVVVRHRKLGYRANAMVVWNIPDDRVTELGSCMGEFEFVTLCYRRPRRMPEWPYNLFCMIHGCDRDAVLQHVAQLAAHCGLGDCSYEVLFSRRCFKQRGAVYPHARCSDDSNCNGVQNEGATSGAIETDGCNKASGI